MRVVALLSFAAFLIALTVTAAITHRHSGGTWAFDAAFDHHSVLSLLCGDTPTMSLCAQALTSSKATGGMHLIRRQVTKRALHLVADGVRHADHLQGTAAVPAAVQRFFARVQSEVAPDASDMDIALAFSKLRKQGVLREMSGDSLAAEQYPYFGFLPRTVGSSPPGAAAFNEPTECFTNVSMSTAWNADSTVLTATLTTAGQTSFLCTDTYAIGLYGVGFKLVSVATEGTITHDFKVDLASRPAAQQWYINNRGLRLFKFNKSVLGLIGDIIDTVILLAGFFVSPVPNATMEANYVFLRDYVEISPRMQPMSQVRTAGMTVVNELNESYIQSGDGLVVVRYDGLDPIIGWGEGFTGGHSTIAIREPTTGILHVCESTAHDGYWTTNGIQCTPWRQWFALAQKADYNVLLAPLTPANAAKFNATAAWAFFNETAGLNYGYLNFLFGWIDVKNGNFPCLPTQYTYCLNEQVVEIVAVLWDELQPTNPENVFRQALNHRVGTWNYSVMEVMQYGFEQYNWTFPDIYIRPELDSWRYNTTRYGAPAVGRSMVCCVFVCHMWKEGGLFDGIGRNINCGDQTLWDIFSMQMFDPTKLNDGRPEVCKKNDPNNELCQLIGGHTFYAKPDFNTRALYPWMGQKCSSLSPDYVREAGC